MAMMRVENCVEIENGNQLFLFFLLFVCLFVVCVFYQPNIDVTITLNKLYKKYLGDTFQISPKS